MPYHSAGGLAAGRVHTEAAPHSSLPDEVERVDGVSDAGERQELEHGPDETDHDMEVDVVGLPGVAAPCGAAGAASFGAPSSARPTDAPSQPLTAEAWATASPHRAAERGTEGAAALDVRQAAGMLCKHLRPNGLQSPVSPDAHELRAEGPAEGSISADMASLQAAQAVGLSLGDAPPAALCALALPTETERLASAAAAAASQAAARSGAVHGTLLPASVQQGYVGSTADTGVMPVQSTEVQAVPSTLVEALPTPQPVTAHHAGAAAAPAMERHHTAGSPHLQHSDVGGAAAAGLNNSQHIHPQVLQHHQSCAAAVACRSLRVRPCCWRQAQAHIRKLLENEDVFWGDR